MTLLDAKPYDAARARRRRIVIVVLIFIVLLGACLAYHFRDYSERATVGKFFAALQKQDFESAYAIWFRDPAWKQHQEKYSTYPFNDFYRDWGPGGEWGIIKSHAVDCSLAPANGSGVIVQVTVNGRAQHAYVWVQKSDKTLSFSPSEIECGNWWMWVTE
ncbi:MAG: hypothetical protein WAL32_18185 [Terriglobales bacterium]